MKHYEGLVGVQVGRGEQKGITLVERLIEVDMVVILRFLLSVFMVLLVDLQMVLVIMVVVVVLVVLVLKELQLLLLRQQIKVEVVLVLLLHLQVFLQFSV